MVLQSRFLRAAVPLLLVAPFMLVLVPATATAGENGCPPAYYVTFCADTWKDDRGYLCYYAGVWIDWFGPLWYVYDTDQGCTPVPCPSDICAAGPGIETAVLNRLLP
ncbi:MAG TPA: hypothetical protein VNZ52_06675 [Candidatus Thermoplasmatota archaeon]|nr:hypothetical protein [Candidatus Thermoplasmatota archaeon]